jgi:hypothetical protein
MAGASGGMGDDFRVPIPNEPSVKPQFFRSVWCRLLRMQSRDQVVGGNVHRASPHLCELDGITNSEL